jgi:class 3 adenylate cyclase
VESHKTRRQSWTWRFAQPAPAIWPVLADTARFNEAARLPNHEIEEKPQADGSVRFFGSTRVGPFHLAWEERPTNWVTDRWLEHCRDFHRGPLSRLCARFELRPDGAGTQGIYEVEVASRGVLGLLMVGSGAFLRAAGKSFAKLAAEAGEFVAGQRDQPFEYAPPPVTPDIRRRVDSLVAEIESTPNGHGLARRLADLVLAGQEVDLWHIRPLQLARDWGVGQRQAIELCLQAVKAGLLDLRWDILCPRCRVAKAWVPSLDRLPQGAHCDSCNIDYDRDFSTNVEASFRPAASVRPLAGGEYCLFGPMSTPHIKLHVTLDPGAARIVDADFAPGRYRLRTLEPGGEVLLDWMPGAAGDVGFPAVTIDEAGDVAAGAPAAPGRVALANRSRRRLTLIVEDRSWLKDVLTADRLTALQAFRDLFAAEVLRPGDDVGIAQVTLMFTDLKGSTALYERIGDARAYRLVREHFAFLGEIVREQEGAIVKTVGDAVMAAFPDPAAAVRAALAVQERVAVFNQSHDAAAPGEAIVIKLGLHRGPCIAVTFNDRLDYFGSTVNLAARLQGQSRGGDIVLSRDMLGDPGVAGVLDGLVLEEDAAELRGFGRRVDYLRLGPDRGAGRASD